MTQLKESLELNAEITWTDINQLTPDSHRVNVRFRVLKRGPIRQVTSKSSSKQYEIADCEVADATAKINLILWNEDIDLVENDNYYYLLNGHITIYEECMSLSKGRNGTIKKWNTSIELMKDEVDMSRPFMWKPRRRVTRTTTSRTLNGTAGREVRRYSSRKSF